MTIYPSDYKFTLEKVSPHVMLATLKHMESGLQSQVTWDITALPKNIKQVKRHLYREVEWMVLEKYVNKKNTNSIRAS